MVCSTMKPREVTEEQIKLCAFPFSLADKAKYWLYYLPSGSITTWDQMKQQFLKKFFLASCAANIRKDICGIRQFNGETLYEYWERFKQLCASYAASGGALVHKMPTDARTLISNMAANSQQFSTRQECPKKSVSEVKTSYDQRLDNLNALVEKLVMGNSTLQVKAYGVCSVVGHPTDMCPTLQDSSPEQMNAIGGFPGQLATSVNRLESQASGKLPSQTINNPKQNASAITLRKGKVLEEQPLKPSKRDLEKEIVKESSTSKTDQPQETSRSQVEIKILPPFLGRFAKSIKQEQDKEILETFPKVKVNILLLDAIKQVPRYAKFLKELCTSKRKLKSNEKVMLGENVSAMIQKMLPIKCKDPGMFTIPCKMGNVDIERAMLDLRASINVMPHSIYEALNVGKLKETGVIIQLADRSYAYPDGVLEDILVQGTLTMEFDGQVIKFNIYNSMKYPSNKHSVFSVDVIDSLVQKVFKLNDEDSLKVALTNTISKSANKELEPNSNLQEAISGLNSLAPVNKIVSYLGLPLNNAKLLPSIAHAPKLKLKKLPDHLKYLFLGEGDTLPAISSNKLTPLEDERLIRVLRDYKEAIGGQLLISTESANDGSGKERNPYTSGCSSKVPTCKKRSKPKADKMDPSI
ncbi:uncharacterized protein Tco_1182858 [Tanacetum coccineum]